MIDVTKLLILTNNDVTEDYFKGQIRTEMVETHKDVLLKVRDYIYAGGWKLITHPMASSIKPNQTPFRSIILIESKEDNTDDIIMIQEAIESFEKFEHDKQPTEWYRETTDADFKKIDFYMIEDAIPHLTR